MKRRPRRTAQLVLGVLALGLVGAGCGMTGDDEMMTMTARFERTVGLYENSDVRILGVRIGRVTELTPDGDTVRVVMEYDGKYKVPASAQAVVVAPSVVSDRYVQLTPAYTDGPEMEDGADLGGDRTAVPVELDQIFSSVDQLNVALGPNGANRNGALADLLDVTSQNLDGNGAALNTTLRNFSTAVQTLSDQRDDLFGTVRNLSDFTTTLARSDDTVRRFNSSLASVADQLEGEKEDLALAIRQLSVALGEVSTFVRDNKDSLTANVSDLADLTGVLVDQKAALEEFLDTAPTALSNLQLAYNPLSGTLDTRSNNFGDELGTTLCQSLPRDVPQAVRDLCGGLLDGFSPGQIEQLLMDPSMLSPQLQEILNGLLGGTAATALTPPDLSVSGLMGGAR